MASPRPTKADKNKSQTKEKQATAVPKSASDSTLASKVTSGKSRKRDSSSVPKAGQPERMSSTSSVGGDEGTSSIGENDVHSSSHDNENRNTSENDLYRHVAIRAFLLYEASGYRDGNDLEHWFEAERQVKELDM